MYSPRFIHSKTFIKFCPVVRENTWKGDDNPFKDKALREKYNVLKHECHNIIPYMVLESC